MSSASVLTIDLLLSRVEMVNGLPVELILKKRVFEHVGEKTNPSAIGFWLLESRIAQSLEQV
jgi:hypothetical protein